MLKQYFLLSNNVEIQSRSSLFTKISEVKLSEFIYSFMIEENSS